MASELHAYIELKCPLRSSIDSKMTKSSSKSLLGFLKASKMLTLTSKCSLRSLNDTKMSILSSKSLLGSLLGVWTTLKWSVIALW